MHLEMKKLGGWISFVVLFAFTGLSARAAPPPDTLDYLELPAPKTFDLGHVEARHFAAALGKAPERIFRFVRDRIGYEVYTGYLRGPRGTLMALAGNSVDQAALLGSLLEQSGHRVRYVRGKLPEAKAKELVESMWAERPQPAPTRKTRNNLEPPAEVSRALDTLVASVERDYNLIRDHLKKANIQPPRGAARSLASLVQEAQEHYWVQWWKDGGWLDFDPSFRNASMGETLARSLRTFESFSRELFHQVTIKIRVEEYTGEKRSERVILTHTANAAHLSGKDLLLSHQPENWKGPAASLQDAMSSAIQSTGRVKPILIIGRKNWVAGEPFRQEPPPTTGTRGVITLISGEGTRKPVPVAVSEHLEFEFLYPDGRKETVVRDIFDRVGKARRATGEKLAAKEICDVTTKNNAFDVTLAVYSMFFTTGSIDDKDFLDLVEDQVTAREEPQDVRALLQFLNVAMAVASDALLGGLTTADGAMISYYPDSSRLLITELSKMGEKVRISLDLRRDRARVTAAPFRPKEAFSARLFRGVVDGTLERVLMDYLFADAKGEDPNWESASSTSALFERAQTNAVPTMLLTGESAPVEGDVPADALARLRKDLAENYLVLAPNRAVILAGKPRFAWWRIDRRSGDTTGVTDEGLHGNSIEREMTIVHSADKSKVSIHFVGRQGGRIVSGPRIRGPYQKGARVVSEILRGARSRGWRIKFRNLY